MKDQANSSFNLAGWDTLVTAWFAFDEPNSIDNYEPIRIVDSILNAESNGRRKLFISFAGVSRYSTSPFGAEPLFSFDEFLRRVKSAHISNNAHIYGPYHEDYNPLGGDYRAHNIENLVDSVLSPLYAIDSVFDVTLICGKYLVADIRQEPTPTEMLYESEPYPI